MNKMKREVINVWPVSNRGVFKGFVKITFAESVAVFPMKLMEGNHGYFLGFPKVTQSDGTKRHAGRFLYLQSILIGICSMAQGPDSVFFNGVTNLPQDGILAFGVKGLMESNAELKDAVLFHLLSYISDKLLVQRNSVGVLDEFYLFLSSPVVVEYVRNMMKRNRKRDSFLILTSQNVEDFLLPSIREYTKPLLSIPAHRFLFYPGTVEESEYCDLLQLEECEFQVIRTASRARCLFQCGNERYKLLIQAPDYKQEMFGTEGGR